ncbi:MAG: putative ABC transporter permease [Acutalibacteraceae bacterium]|nr:hypothetical protein [Clostridiales bacterium]
MKKPVWLKMKCALGIFCIGGLAYNAIEILWRGYTHWSMFIVGGACFQIIGRVQSAFRHVSLFRRCVLCSAAITAVEFASGCLFNLHMKLNVWDYSKMFGNLYGQVCLLYSVLWGGLSVIAMPLHTYCYRFLERAGKPHHAPWALESASQL